jgi:hypothetical protein
VSTDTERPAWYLIDNDERVHHGPFSSEEEADATSDLHDTELFSEYGRRLNDDTLHVLRWPEDRPAPEYLPGTDADTVATVDLIRRAAGREQDFGGWLANVLRTAGELLADGDWLTLVASDKLIAGRPGSWEAELVQRLADGGTSLLAEPLPQEASGT